MIFVEKSLSMKNKIFILLFGLLISCSGRSQKLNQEIADTGAQPYLIGKINQEGLSSGSYANWFEKSFQDYQPDEKTMQLISTALKSYDIKLFMGTWCGDSRREVPRFYKVLAQANFPMNQLNSVAVSRSPDLYKQSPNHEEKGLNIHRVPTFIFYKDGVEVNRIVERPVTSLEDDIAAIIKGDYISKYYAVSLLDEIIDKPNFYELALKELPRYKDLVSSMYELNTYAKFLNANKRTTKALEVYKLNTVLFSNQPRTFMNYAKALGINGDREAAVAALDAGLKKHPNNQQLNQNLNRFKSN